MGRSIYKVEMLDKGVIHPTWNEIDEGFHHTTQNDKQFKTYELFVSGIFGLIFLDRR